MTGLTPPPRETDRPCSPSRSQALRMKITDFLDPRDLFLRGKALGYPPACAGDQLAVEAGACCW
jgi:hypothetical protein